MFKVALLLCSVWACYASAESRKDANITPPNAKELSPAYLITRPGDWYALEFGNGKELYRREYVDLIESKNSKEPEYLAVGWIHQIEDGKSHVKSYVGSEKGVKIIGEKNIKNVADVNPIILAKEFGYKVPEHAFQYFV